MKLKIIGTIITIVLFMFVLISIWNLPADYAKQDLKIWSTCGRFLDSIGLPQNATEYQKTINFNLISDRESGNKISFIGRVIDVKENPMDGVYIILQNPYSKENNDTDVYAFVPTHYGAQPLPEEIFKRNIIKVYGQYSGFCQAAKDRYLIDIIIERFEILNEL